MFTEVDKHGHKQWRRRTSGDFKTLVLPEPELLQPTCCKDEVEKEEGEISGLLWGTDSNICPEKCVGEKPKPGRRAVTFDAYR